MVSIYHKTGSYDKSPPPARPSSKAKRGGRWHSEAVTDEGEWTTKCLFIIKSDCKLNIRPTQWPSSETGEGGTRSVTDEGNGL